MTKIAMANWPIAMKIDVEGYIAMMLAPTYDPMLCKAAARELDAYLRTKCEVAKDGDDLVYHRRRTY